MNVFNFDPDKHKNSYTKDGFVHISSGIDPKFLEFARNFARDALEKEQETSLKEWEFKNKKIQFLFDFPQDVDINCDVKDVIRKIACPGYPNITLCERHIKIYDSHAPSHPPAHKDRVASEVTVGIPLEVPKESYMVLYPNHYRDVNFYSSTALYRSSLNEDSLPEKVLADIEPVVLHVWPGDVILFKGSSMYHERVNPANTSLLYLKFNGMNLDPLGEDPTTSERRNMSLQTIESLSDEALLHKSIMVSPRVEKVSRHFSRLYWKEVLQLYIWGEKEHTISEYDFSLIKAIGDGGIIVADVLRRTGIDDFEFLEYISRVRHLIRFGAIDLHQSYE